MKNILLNSPQKSISAEEYRTLRTNMDFSLIDNNYRVIAITSCNQAEGKSTVISNLAISMAQNEKSVLLVDCDLRKPTIHKKFQLSNKLGLTDVLLGKNELNEVIQKKGLDNLSIITSGHLPPNPAEIIASHKMKNFLESVKEKFDLILFDTTPLLVVSDAQILSTIVDGVLLLGTYGKTEKALMVKAKEVLTKAGGKILGVVINKIPPTEKSYYNSYYYEEKSSEETIQNESTREIDSIKVVNELEGN